LRRFQGVGAAAPITPFSGNLSYPASLSPQNSPHSSPHSPDSSGFLHLFLQPLFGGIKDKLVDTLHD
jgi:hypothetical protein